jgi:hypothetical protein
MIKTITIFLLAACFLVEDIVELTGIRVYTVCYCDDPAKGDPSDNKEKDGEEKTDEYKIHHDDCNTVTAISPKSKRYLSVHESYLQHTKEITSPPPDHT